GFEERVGWQSQLAGLHQALERMKITIDLDATMTRQGHRGYPRDAARAPFDDRLDTCHASRPPQLHPRLERQWPADAIQDVARVRMALADLYRNGHALTRKAQRVLKTAPRPERTRSQLADIDHRVLP